MKGLDSKTCIRIVRNRAHGMCERCGRFGQSHHHRLKRSQGGLWTPENVVVLCGHGTIGCHGWVEHNPKAADAEGFHVRPWESPAEKPLLLMRSRWVRLSTDGWYITLKSAPK